MTRSKSEIYLHSVWATHRRLPLIAADVEPALHSALCEQAVRLGCTVLALGGMPDHVHLIVRVPAKRAPSELMQQIKGASSSWMRGLFRKTRPLSAEPFGWQDNFAVFSLSRSHLKLAVAYVRNQKRHHAVGDLYAQWEETDEPA